VCFIATLLPSLIGGHFFPNATLSFVAGEEG